MYVIYSIRQEDICKAKHQYHSQRLSESICSSMILIQEHTFYFDIAYRPITQNWTPNGDLQMRKTLWIWNERFFEEKSISSIIGYSTYFLFRIRDSLMKLISRWFSSRILVSNFVPFGCRLCFRYWSVFFVKKINKFLHL